MGNDKLTDGALRAMAMLRMVPDDETIAALIDLVARRSRDDGLRFWIVAIVLALIAMTSLKLR